MPPISKDLFTHFSLSVHSFMPPHANGTHLANILERQIFIPSGRMLNNIIYTTIWMLTENNNVYIIVIYVVITVNYCKIMLLLYGPLNSYLYVHWILDMK